MLHNPILVPTFLSFFEKLKIEAFIDCTVGAGGHAKALLKSHPEIVRFYGIDQDEEALAIAQEALLDFAPKVHLLQGNFSQAGSLVPEKQVEGIFVDLGVSSMQLDRPERGFSLYKDGPLDMRMDQNNPLTAEKVVNTSNEKELGAIFRDLGEEPRWRKAAQALIEARKKKRIKTTLDLTEALKGVLSWQGRRGKRIHPLTLIFQGLRIYVNDELGVLERALPIWLSLLAPGGRLGILSFHSLEDRIVKHTFRSFAAEGKALILTKKPLVADEEEVKSNPRSRSAKLRFLEKIQ